MEAPPCLMDDSGDAPVPPLSPLINTTSPWPLDTPAAIVPTPDLRDQLNVDPRGSGSPFFRSWMSWARSSIEYMSWCGGRRDKLDARWSCWRTQPMVVVDLAARELTALAGLGALRHLDLKVCRVGQIVDR